MKIFFTALIIALTIISAQGCTFVRFKDVPDELESAQSKSHRPIVNASPTISTRLFELDAFDEINVKIPTDIRYVVSEDGNWSAEVSAPENYLDHIELKTEEGCLNIQFDDKGRYRSSKVCVTVFSPSLASARIQGAGDFMAEDGCGASEELTLTIQGAGDVNVAGLDIERLSILIQGAGDVVASGKAEEVSVTIQGAGDVDIRSLEAGSVNSTIQGAGEIKRN